MVDNLSTDVQQETNVTFLEERAKFQETPFPTTNLRMPSGIESEMAESHWMARQQLSKPMQLSQVTWNTTQAVGTNIVDFTFPEVISTIDSVIQRTLSMYAFYKMSPIFRFQLNSTQFHQGQLIISFDPFRQSVTTTPTTNLDVSPFFNRYYATGLPSVKIMASESDPVELKIPYIHPKNFLSSYSQSAQSYNLMGEVRVTVLNQLKAAEGAATNLTLTTWMYAADSSVHVPMYYHDLRVQPTSLISDITSTVSNGSNLIGNFATGNFGQGLRSGQGLIDNLGKLFGFDYPSRPLAPENTIKNVENLAIARGATRSERLALDPSSSHNPDQEETMTSRDEMDINTVIKMPMLLSQFQYNSTQASQTELIRIPVTPYIFANLGNTTTTDGQQPSYLAYLSEFFNFWRGSITYEFEFVATRFHSGKLLVGFVPNFNLGNAENTYQNIANANPMAILDLQQTSKLSFTVPYQSTTPLKLTRYRTLDESILGTIYVYVQNQLSYASNVSPSVDVNVYIRAGEDFTFLVPRAPQFNFARPAPTTASVNRLLEPTSDITFLTSRTGQEDNSVNAILSHGQSLSIPKPRFGETYSIIDCIRRFTSYNENQSLTSTGANYINGVHPVYTADLTPGALNNTYDFNFKRSYLGYLGKLYSCWTGSLRLKFCTTSPRTKAASLSVYHLPDYQFLANPNPQTRSESTLAGYAGTTTDLSQNTSLEFEIPFYSPFNFLLTHPSTGTGSAHTTYLDSSYYPYTNGTFLTRVIGADPNDVSARSYIAAGEDFKYFYLRSPPPVYNGLLPSPTINTPI